MKSITEIFPKASKSFLEANPLSSPSEPIKTIPSPTGGSGKRGSMNKTENEFAIRLQHQLMRGEILRWEYEGITLRFANVKYTPDFVVFGIAANGISTTPTRLRFIEIKGPFIKGNRERAVERFRHAKTYWPEFTFEMMQKNGCGWEQII